MAVIKVSKNNIIKNDISDNKIKVKRNQLSCDSAKINSWKYGAKKSLKALQDYNIKLINKEYFSANDLKLYKSALDGYIENNNHLRRLNKTFGQGYPDVQEKEWNDAISSLQNQYKEISDYFSNFKNEYEFKDRLAAIKKQEIMRAEDVDAGMAEVNSILSSEKLTALKDEKAKLEKKRENAYRARQRRDAPNLRDTGIKNNIDDKRLAELEKEISAIEEPVIQRKEYLTQAKYLQNYFYLTEKDVSLDELKSHLSDDDPIAYTDPSGKNITWQKLIEDKEYERDLDAWYEKYSSLPDWNEYSTFVSKSKHIEDLRNGANIKDFGTDLALEYIYGDDEFRSLLTTARYGHASSKDNMTLMLGSAETYGTRRNYDYGEQYGYDLLNNKEKAIFTYLRQKLQAMPQDEQVTSKEFDALNEFERFMEDKLVERHNKKEVADAYEMAQKYPVGSSLMSVGYNLMGGVEYLMDAALGTNDAGNQNAALSSAIRQGVSDTVDWEIGNWDAFDFLYNTGMSMADSVVAMGTMGALGGVALGLSAAGQGVNDALDRGLSGKEAFWNGLASGVFEMIFETVSIGQFSALKESLGSGIKNIAKNIGKSMLVNASEETLTEIANIIYDNIENADFSNYETMIRAYVMQGMSIEQAKTHAKNDLKNQVLESMASGGLMGLGFGSFGSAEANKNAKIIEGNYSTASINNLISKGMSVFGSEAYVLAQKAQAKLGRGESLTAQELVALEHACEESFDAAEVSKIRQVVKMRLEELGEGESAGMIADIITKQTTGQKITSDEKKFLKDSMYGQLVANEMSAENIVSGNFSSGWTKSIGTDRINKNIYNGNLQSSAGSVVDSAKDFNYNDDSIKEGESYGKEQLRNGDTGRQFTGANTQSRIGSVQETSGGIYHDSPKSWWASGIVRNQGNNRGIANEREEQLRNGDTGRQFTGANTQSRIGSVQETSGGIYRNNRESGTEPNTIYNQGNNRGIELSQEQFEGLKNTVIKNEDGTPKMVYHFTNNMDFEVFAKGDIGFHFGNELQARQRGKNLKQQGRIITAFLDIKNPIYINTDLMSWRPAHVAIKLYADGIITYEQYLYIEKKQVKSGYEYNSPAAVSLRKILADLGYDGIIYENHYEGDGQSYIAFYPEQIIIIDDGKVNTNQAISENEIAFLNSEKGQTNIIDAEENKKEFSQEYVDGSEILNYNDDSIKEGEIYGSENTKLLERGTVSAAYRGDNILRKPGTNSETLAACLGMSKGSDETNIQRIRVGECGWLVEKKNSASKETRKSFNSSVFGRIRGVKLSGKDTIGGESQEFSQEYIDELLESFGITKPGDYIHVQKRVMETLESEGFFTDKENRCTKVVNDASGMVVEINKSGIKETFNLDNYARLGKFKKLAKLATIRKLKTIIKQGKIIADNVQNKYNDVSLNKSFGYVEFEIAVDNNKFVVKIAIKKSPQKNKFCVHSIYAKNDVSDSLTSTNSSTEVSHITANTNIDDQNVMSEKGHGTFSRIVKGDGANNIPNNVKAIKSGYNKVSADKKSISQESKNVNEDDMQAMFEAVYGDSLKLKDAGLRSNVDGVVDSVKGFNYNDNNIKEGENYNGENTELLERGAVSTAYRGDNILRKPGTNSRALAACLGVSQGSGEAHIQTIRAGECGWLVKKSNNANEKTRQSFNISIFRRIRGAKLSGKDTIGGTVSTEILERFKNTICKDEKGNLISLYHWTQEIFEEFAKGEFGFHFGTLRAAYDRYLQTKEEKPGVSKGIYKEVILNITNPIEIIDENGIWTADWVAFQLLQKGIIDEQKYNSLSNLAGFDDNTYDNPAAQAVRTILAQNGYDGIIYENLSEDVGSYSVIALYPEQIITVAENGVLKENSGISRAISETQVAFLNSKEKQIDADEFIKGLRGQNSNSTAEQDAGLQLMTDGVVDSLKDYNYNDNSIKEGEIYGSENTELLERGTVSAAYRGDNILRKPGTNSEMLAACLEISQANDWALFQGIWAGESDWIDGSSKAKRKQTGDKTSNGFAQRVIGKIRRVKLSGKDTVGGTVTPTILKRFKNTICKDKNGNLISLYHWTLEIFEEFAMGEFGFHFGTLRVAHDRYLQTKEDKPDISNGVYKEVIVNITNPIELSDDVLEWTAGWVAIQLLEKGIIGEQLYYELEMMPGFDEKSYDNPAAEAVRNILIQNGYDGIIYENLSEDVGSYSLIALYPEQIITVAENGVLKENSGISRAISGPQVAFFNSKEKQIDADEVVKGMRGENNDAEVLTQYSTNAVTNPLSSYAPAKRGMIIDFLESVDEKLKAFVERVKNGSDKFERFTITDVSGREAADIKDLLGIDVSGYTHNINTSGIKHILKRHGVSGNHDHTMSNDNDIARMGWVINNYDNVEMLFEKGEVATSGEFKDKLNRPVPQIRYSKKINGTYYVVEAVFENNHNKLWVQSAYLSNEKEVVTPDPDAANRLPMVTSETPPASPTSYEGVTQDPAEGQKDQPHDHARSALASPTSNNNISQSEKAVNDKYWGQKSNYDRGNMRTMIDDVHGGGLSFKDAGLQSSADGVVDSVKDFNYDDNSIKEGEIYGSENAELLERGAVPAAYSGDNILRKPGTNSGGLAVSMEISQGANGAFRFTKRTGKSSWIDERKNITGEESRKSFDASIYRRIRGVKLSGKDTVAENGVLKENSGISRAISGPQVAFFNSKEKQSNRIDADEFLQGLRSEEDQEFSQEYIDELLESFGITKPGDYIHVQKRVMETLENEGFFTDKENRCTKVVNDASGMVVEINKNGIDETFNLHNYSRVGRNRKLLKLAIVNQLPEIIESGELIEDNVKNSHEGSAINKSFAYIRQKVTIDGKTFVVQIDIKKSPQKNKFWVHKIIKNKDANDFPASNERDAEAGQRTIDTIDIYLSQENTNVNNDFSTNTGIFNGVQELNVSVVGYIEKICNQLGRKVVFEDLRDMVYNGEIISPDGYIKDGVIHINTYAENPLGFVFKHELTHYVENFDGYKEFANAVKSSSLYDKWLKEKTNEEYLWDAEELYRRMVYESQSNFESIDDPKIDKEIIADFVGGMLFSDDGSGLLSLATELQPKQRNAFVQWVLDFISYVKKKLNGISGIMLELSKLEDSFNRLLSDAKNNDGVYDNEIKFSIAGENSKAANHSLLFEAKLRYYKGEDSESIRRDTGWYKGRDDKWRYYIPDNELNIDKLVDFVNSGEKTALLGDVIVHDKLFKAYPELKNVKVKFEYLEIDSNGKYTPKSNMISIDYELLNDTEMMADVLIHEVQHAIQIIEGFARGGNEKIGFYYAINTAYDMVCRSKEFNALTTKEEKFDCLCNIALKIFNAKSIEELVYNAYLNIYGEVEARQSAKYRKYDENYIKLVEPDIDGNVINNLHEKNNFFAMLKLLGYNDSEIDVFRKKAGIIGANKWRNGNIDSQSDISRVQREWDNLREIDESRSNKRINFGKMGNRGRIGLLYSGSDSRTAISNEAGKDTGKLLGAGVRGPISSRQRTKLAEGLENTVTFENEATSNKEVAFFGVQKRNGLNQVIELLSDKELLKKQSGLYEVLDANEQDYIQQICDKLGIEVVFEDLRQMYYKGKMISPDGYIKNGVIHLNLYAQNPIGFVLKHELTHYSENASNYKKFANAVKSSSLYDDWIRSKTDKEYLWDAEEVYRQMVYESQSNFESINDPKIDNEIIADFVGEMLFTENGSGITALSSQKDTKHHNVIVQFLLDFISYVKKKLNGISGIMLELSKLEDSFNRLLSDANNNEVYDENLLKMVEPNTDGNVIDNSKEKNKFFATLKLLGYNDSEVRNFLKKAGIIGDKSRNGYMDSRSDTSRVQRGGNNLRGIDEPGSYDEVKFGTSGNRGWRTVLPYSGSNSRTAISNEGIENKGKFLGTGVRAAISTQEKSISEKELDENVIWDTAFYHAINTAYDMVNRSEEFKSFETKEEKFDYLCNIAFKLFDAKNNDGVYDNEIKFSFDKKSIDKYGFNQDKVSGANKQGDFVNEFYNALSKREWVAFYSQLGAVEYLCGKVGTIAPLIIGNKFVIAKREYVGKDKHDYVVKDVFQLNGDYAAKDLLELIADKIIKGELNYERQTMRGIILRILERNQSTGVLTNFDGVSQQYVYSDSKREDGINDEGIYNYGEKRVAGRGILLGGKPDFLRNNGILEKENEATLSDEVAFSMPIGKRSRKISNKYVSFSGSKGSEILYNTPKEFMPESEQEWSTFNRQFSNKTSHLKKGGRKNIIIYTASNVYFVQATGYLEGCIQDKISIYDNEELISKKIKEYLDGAFVIGKTFYSSIKGTGSRNGRGDRDINSLEGRYRQSQNVDLDERQSASDDVRYHWENYGYQTWEELINAIDSGVLIMDENGEILNLDSEETIKATSKSEVAFSMPIGKRKRKDNNVIELSKDNELSKKIGDLRGAAKYKVIQQYILEILGGEQVVLSDGKIAVVDKSDALHIANEAANKKTAQISAIRELVEKAQPVAEDESTKERKFDYFYYYKTTVKYDGEIFNVYINVGRAINNGTYHIYNITNKIRDTANRINGLERPKPNEGYALTNGISYNSITKIDDEVNNNSSTNTGIFNGVQELNVSEVGYIEKICNQLGRKVVFEDLRDMVYNGEIISPDGYIKDRVIHINTYAENPLGFVFKHELTHYVENFDGYKEFANAVKSSSLYDKWLKEKTNEEYLWDAEELYRRMVYESQSDFESIDDPKIDKEIIADFVGEMLFSDNGSSLVALTAELKPKKKNFVLQFVCDFIAWIKSKFYKHNYLMLELSVLEAGFRRLLNSAEENTAHTDGNDISFCFVRCDDDAKKAKADEMEQSGASATEIYDTLGVFRNVFGEWATTLDLKKLKFWPYGNSSTSYNLIKKPKSIEGSLRDVVFWPELYELFPEFKEVRLVIKYSDNPVDTVRFFPNEKGGVIFVNQKLCDEYKVDTRRSMAKVYLVREIQRMIQAKEGHYIGHSLEYWKKFEKQGRLPYSKVLDRYLTAEDMMKYFIDNYDAEMAAKRQIIKDVVINTDKNTNNLENVLLYKPSVSPDFVVVADGKKKPRILSDKLSYKKKSRKVDQRLPVENETDDTAIVSDDVRILEKGHATKRIREFLVSKEKSKKRQQQLRKDVSIKGGNSGFLEAGIDDGDTASGRLVKQLSRKKTTHVADCDTIGRILNNEIKEKLETSIAINEKGEPISLYTISLYGEDVFRQAQLGLRLGTIDFAVEEYESTARGNANLNNVCCMEFYADVKNPFYLVGEPYELSVDEIGMQLVEKGVILPRDYKWLLGTRQTALAPQYNGYKISKLRGLIKEAGYDGLIYKNQNNDPGSMTLVVFDKEQLIPVSKDGRLIEKNGIVDAVYESETFEKINNSVQRNIEKLSRYIDEPLYSKNKRKRPVDERIKLGSSDYFDKKEITYDDLIEKLQTNNDAEISGYDTAGRKFNRLIVKKLEHCVFKDEQGNIISFCLWNTKPKNISQAGKMGIEFGTVNSAFERFFEHKKNKGQCFNGVFEEFILNCENPLIVPFNEWNTLTMTEFLLKKGMITHKFYSKMLSLKSLSSPTYVSAAAQILREKLKMLGYDSLIFVKDAGQKTVVPFYNEQIIPISQNGILNENCDIFEPIAEYNENHMQGIIIDRKNAAKRPFDEISSIILSEANSTKKLKYLTEYLGHSNNTITIDEIKNIKIGYSGDFERGELNILRLIALSHRFESMINHDISGYDTCGRMVDKTLQNMLKSTVFKDENGSPLSFFLWNRFDEYRFKHISMGYCVSTLTAAHDLYLEETENRPGIKMCQYEEYFVVASKPYVMKSFTYDFKTKEFADDLYQNGILKEIEYRRVLGLHGIDTTENQSWAANFLIRKLKQNGYDSIVYMNGKRDPGSMGVIVFEKSQLISITQNGKTVKNNLLSETDSDNEAVFFMPQNRGKNFVENSQFKNVEIFEENGIIEETVDNDIGVPGEYNDKIMWSIYKYLLVRKHGKGYYGKRVKQHNSRVDNYELKINPNNESYYLQHPDGRYVQFENMVDNVLQDGKCVLNKERSFYHVYDYGYIAQKRVLDQANRQVEVANAVGYKVEWLISDEKAVEQISRLFKENNINISVKFYPE